MLKKRQLTSKYRHAFHIVSPSLWPFLLSANLFALVIGGVMYLHAYQYGGLLLSISFVAVLSIMALWWVDIIFEATFEAAHTKIVQRGLRMGLVLFIVSEIMFFFAFFWAFFHSCLSPAIQIGAIWPPLGLTPFNPWEIPFLNTIILVFSGWWATKAHHIIITKEYSLLYGHLKTYLDNFGRYLIYAILLGCLFTCFQLYEYIIADFSISDSVYGSVFYLATGFHGAHVLVGTLFLMVVFFRHREAHFIGRHYFGVDAAMWYWHFVDVVWLFLFLVIYWWGS